MPRRKTTNQKVKEFQRWLKGEMSKQDLNQTDIASCIGVSQQKVSERLLGNTPFKLEEIIAIFELLGTDKETIGKLLSL